MIAAVKNKNEEGAVPATRATSATYNLIGVALAAIAAIAFSLRAIFVKLAYEDMSDPITLLALRMIFCRFSRWPRQFIAVPRP
jgi:hypothetical protein